MIHGRTLRCRDPNPGMLFAAEFCIWVLGVTRDDTILIFGGGTLPAGCNENFFLPPIWVNSWRFTFSTSSKNDTVIQLKPFTNCYGVIIGYTFHLYWVISLTYYWYFVPCNMDFFFLVSAIWFSRQVWRWRISSRCGSAQVNCGIQWTSALEPVLN